MDYCFSIILAVFLLSTMPSCQDKGAEPQYSNVKLELTMQEEEKIKKDNAFTFDLLSEVLDDLSDQKNAMLSPLSMNMVLSMTANGVKKLSDVDRWDGYQRDFYPRQTQLSLPKFKFSYENKLNDELERLGMGLAFSNQADFRGIEENGGLAISEVKHKTFIEVNEEGTEAAAVTSVGIFTTSMPQYYQLNFDRPFLFFIREKTSGLILFAGQVNNPNRN